MSIKYYYHKFPSPGSVTQLFVYGCVFAVLSQNQGSERTGWVSLSLCIRKMGGGEFLEVIQSAWEKGVKT